MSFRNSPYSGRRITVMGLGLHGGGLAAALYLHRRGARVTVTDLRTTGELAPTLRKLPESIRVVAGEHREKDFLEADLVLKNPAVPRTAPLLKLAPAVTTDIALFLAEWTGRLGGDRGPLVAVTGTKGKSSTAAATAAILGSERGGTRLGGNITISPLGFLEELQGGDPVVLELSSFQLGDLRFCREINRPGNDALPEEVLFPRLNADVAIVTSIFPDHQDYYDSIDSYVRDKEEILRHLRPGALAILGCTEGWKGRFAAAAAAGAAGVTVREPEDEEIGDLLPPTPAMAGTHMRRNLFFAALAARHLGVPPDQVRAAAGSFTGVAHRLERIGEREGLEIVNDTAATIPEATLAAAEAYTNPLVLIAGGSDKGLDSGVLVRAGRVVLQGGGAIILLEGSATDLLVPLFREAGIPLHGPERSLRASFARAVQLAREIRAGEAAETVTILLSPGCASFGMFRNEFDRGDQFRALAEAFLATGAAP